MILLGIAAESSNPAPLYFVLEHVLQKERLCARNKVGMLNTIVLLFFLFHVATCNNATWQVFNCCWLGQTPSSKNAEALTHLNEALKLQPENAKALFWRGRTHTALGNYEQARYKDCHFLFQMSLLKIFYFFNSDYYF